MASQTAPGRSSTDTVIVVGAGGCGLVAALAGAQRGAQVLLLEKTDSPGGTTALSHGGVIASGTRFQRQAGIEDDPGQLVQEILRRNGGQSDIGVTERLAQRSAGVVEWLADLTGVEFEVSLRQVGHSAPRSHTWGSGPVLIQHLMAAVERQENLRLRCSTAAVSLDLDDGGAVTGVVTEGGVIAGAKVILAAGGFGASHDLLSQYIPKAADMPYEGHHGSTGDGLRMGMAAGGAAEDLGAFQPYPAYFTPLRLPVPQDVLHLGGIQVDEHGRRFVDETKFPGLLGAKRLELPSEEAYEIFDERVYESARGALAKVIDAGILEKGKTVKELAQGLGVDPLGLDQTIREYNAAAAQGRDEFGRTVSASLGLPLYGVKVWVALYHTQGGLKVNTNAQVLRPDGSVVPNLYAGGGAATAVSGPGPAGYLPGNGLFTALGLGKLAGEHAADSLRLA
jgi:fumarate reductase flavoprotein subunit